jgi:serine O-acetyltransferase
MGQFSVVVGGVHIGNDVVIAPGAFINFDVPDNSIVIGNPAQVIHQDVSPAMKYIVHSVEDYR